MLRKNMRKCAISWIRPLDHCVWIRFAKNIFCVKKISDQLTMNDEYKIDYISKTECHTKKTHKHKYSFQNIAHLLRHHNFLPYLVGKSTWNILNKINHKSKNKNQKIDCLFVSSHCASFMKIWTFLRRRGKWSEWRGKWRGGVAVVCTSLLGTFFEIWLIL